MVISWVLFVSTGILLARYYKYLLPNFKLFGVEFWFLLHTPIMIFAIVCTIIAFCVALAALEGMWPKAADEVKFAHSIFGILTIIISLIQVNYLILNTKKLFYFFFQ